MALVRITLEPKFPSTVETAIGRVMAEREGWLLTASSNGDAPHREKPAAETRPAAPARRPPRLSALLGGILLGGGAALAIAVAALGFFVRGVLPPLTAADLKRAEERWQAAGPRDYDMLVRVTGRQPSEFRVEVRRGEPALLSRNGNATPRRMWDVWTVPGMFDTIHQEIDQAENPAGPFGSPRGTKVVQRVAFDARYGYPARYERIVMGTPLEIAWEVAEFREIASEANPGERGAPAR
jgi:hypothetical protein